MIKKAKYIILIIALSIGTYWVGERYFFFTSKVNAKLLGSGIPRFVSLKRDKGNLRSGPGKKYPIQWVLNNKGMPVKILLEYDLWRKIELLDGTIGWIHKNLLCRINSVVIINDAVLRSKSTIQSKPVAYLQANSLVTIVSRVAHDNFLKIRINDITGWVQISKIWGVILQNSSKD